MVENPNHEDPTFSEKDASGLRWLINQADTNKDSSTEVDSEIGNPNGNNLSNNELLGKIDELQSQVNQLSNKLDKSAIRPKILTHENIEKTYETVTAGFGLTIVGFAIVGFVVFFVMSVLGMILY